MPRDISRHFYERKFYYNSHVCISVWFKKKFENSWMLKTLIKVLYNSELCLILFNITPFCPILNDIHQIRLILQDRA